jgi:hypothetical protein
METTPTIIIVTLRRTKLIYTINIVERIKNEYRGLVVTPEEIGLLGRPSGKCKN